MSMKGLAIGSDVESSDKDILAGGGFTKDTGVYDMIVDTAYMGKSASGAVSVNLILKSAKPGDNTTFRQTLWVASGDKKGNKNYYVDKNNKKRLLPGMAQADHISHICTEKPLATLTPEEKTIKLYDFDKKAEMPTKVAALTEMHGAKMKVGVHKVRANKVVKNQAGGYDDTAAERIYNEIDKVFYPDGLTLAEKRDGTITEPVFLGRWVAKFPEDYVDDQYKKVAGSPADAPLPDEDSSAVTDIFNTD
jgi:hypothetical protein